MNKIQSAAAMAIGAVGLVVGVFSAMWLVGTLGVSNVTAWAIVKAVEVGSWAMFLTAIAATGGLVGVGLWGALKLMLAKVGSKAIVA